MGSTREFFGGGFEDFCTIVGSFLAHHVGSAGSLVAILKRCRPEHRPLAQGFGLVLRSNKQPPCFRKSGFLFRPLLLL